jgi:hypothetical protein
VIDLALAKRYIAKRFVHLRVLKFAQQVFGAVAVELFCLWKLIFV